jgi:zinc protease
MPGSGSHGQAGRLLAGWRRRTQTATAMGEGSHLRLPSTLIRATLACAISTSLLSLAAKAEGEPEAGQAEFGGALGTSIERATLPSGLRMVMDVEHRSPTVGVCAAYDVGLRDQARGDAGLLEELARWVTDRAELESILHGRGGELVSSVEDDRYVVCATVPNHELEVAAWATTAWLRPLPPQSQESPGRRRRDAGFFRDWERLRAMVLGGDSGPPNREVSADALARFRERWFRPDRAIMSAVGDFDADRLVEVLGGELAPAPPRGAAPSHSQVLASPDLGPRVVKVERPELTGSVLLLGWRVPPRSSSDYPVLEFLADLLGTGAAGLLGQRLASGERLAESVSVHLTRSRGPNVLGIRIELPATVLPERAELVVGALLQELATRDCALSDWTRAGARAWRRKLARWEKSRQRAEWLGAVELEGGDPRGLWSELTSHAKLSPAQARTAVGRYLGFAGRSVLVERPVP